MIKDKKDLGKLTDQWHSITSYISSKVDEELKKAQDDAYTLGYERAKSEFAVKWNDGDDVPADNGTYLVADQFGNVVPYLRSIIHSNNGTESDWRYSESKIVAWAELPKYSKLKTKYS